MKNFSPLSQQEELECWKQIESAELLLFETLSGFGFIAKEYVKVARTLLGAPEQFEKLVIYRENPDFKSSYLAGLPELIQAVEKTDLDCGGVYGKSTSEWERKFQKQYMLQEFLKAFQFNRKTKMEFVVTVMSYRDAIAQSLPEKGDEIKQLLRISVNQFNRDCEKIQELQRKTETIRQQLIEADTEVVWNEVRMYSDFGLLEDELFSAGQEGILKATLKFNYRQGYRFAPYAKWWIKQNITKAIYERTGKDMEELRKEKKG